MIPKTPDGTFVCVIPKTPEGTFVCVIPKTPDGTFVYVIPKTPDGTFVCVGGGVGAWVRGGGWWKWRVCHLNILTLYWFNVSSMGYY